MISQTFSRHEELNTLAHKHLTILCNRSERIFDRLAELAAKQFDVSTAVISFIDADQQCFKSSYSFPELELSGDLSFQNLDILNDGIFVMTDTVKDDPSKNDPLVTAEAGIRFYCTVPLIAATGQRIGALSILDHTPRENFGLEDQQCLTNLAAIIIDQVEMCKTSGHVVNEVKSLLEIEHHAATTECQIQALVECAPGGLALFNLDGYCLAASLSWRDHTDNLGDLVSMRNTGTAPNYKLFETAFLDALQKKSTTKPEEEFVQSSGEISYLNWEIRPWVNKNGDVERVIFSVTDVTPIVVARKHAEQQGELLNAVLENIQDGIVACDAEGTLTMFNRTTRQMHGIDFKSLPPEECTQFYNLFEKDGTTPLEADRIPLFEALQGKQVIDREMVIAPIDQPPRKIVSQATPLFNEQGITLGAVASMADVTETRKALEKLKASEAQANFIAFHDSLTGLPNRANYLKMTRRKRNNLEDNKVAAMFLDLNGFKAINDKLGHKFGDDLLKLVAKKITGAVGNDAFTARIGGDEFIIFLPIAGQKQACDLAQDIMDSIRKPTVVNGRTIEISVSIGIAISPEHGIDHDELLRRADIAMFRCKDQRNIMPILFEPHFELEAIKRRVLEDDLQRALKNGEMEIYFQAIVSANTQELLGTEALVRWNHPRHGQISPAEFIPIAEESGFIIELGDWVLRNAMIAAKDWDNLFLSVNLSPVQFGDELLSERVFDAIKQIKFDPRRLELEITEGVLLYDIAIAQNVIGKFKSYGISIALDDFGTGYSSLGYIRNIPFDKIKIDRSFISDIGTNIQSTAVVKCVIELASTLGMVVTAEGIETDRQEKELKSMGCDSLQGYKYNKPMPAVEFERLKLFQMFKSA